MQCHTIFRFQNHRFKWQIRPFKNTTNNTNVRHRYPSRAKALRCMHVSAWCVYLLKPSARDDVFTILANLFLGNFSSRFITVFFKFAVYAFKKRLHNFACVWFTSGKILVTQIFQQPCQDRTHWKLTLHLIIAQSILLLSYG